MHLTPGSVCELEVHRTGFHANAAYTGYLEMGSPKDLTEAQITQLNGLTRDLPVMHRITRAGRDGLLNLSVPMNSNDIVLMSAKRADLKSSERPRHRRHICYAATRKNVTAEAR